ncbi:hypothetical protein FK004_16760 [Flavobacterium kingsejongi]|uniref:Uncharacterized protein n=2 Tax=Flavobacterium kingsejongi TaxID=1678728 RepID=A0A2S1LSV9_9FLAO|nr:hypothetical protein FK004_16760 [Flavobacterium kingsejongi]
MLILNNEEAKAQSVKVYPTVISGQAQVTAPNNATDGNLTTSATLTANSGVLGVGATTGYIELEYPTTLPANTTSYIKITTQENLLSPLLGGSLGNLLSTVLGTVLIGNQEFSVEAKNGTTTVQLNESSNNGFSTVRSRILVNANNEYFIAITPSLPYNRIRVTNRYLALLGLAQDRTLQVYDAYYISGSSGNDCGIASATAFDGSGLTWISSM